MHRFFDRHQIGVDRMIFQNVSVDQIFDLFDLSIGHRLIMRKIKPQIIGRNDRTGLLYVRSQNFFECRVNQMRRRMIPPRRIAFFRINSCRYGIAYLERTFIDLDLMNDQTRNRRKRISNDRANSLLA